MDFLVLMPVVFYRYDCTFFSSGGERVFSLHVLPPVKFKNNFPFPIIHFVCVWFISIVLWNVFLVVFQSLKTKGHCFLL